jgi:sortase B
MAKKTQSDSVRSPEQKRAAQKRRKRSYLISGLFLGICIVVLLFSLWQLLSIFLAYRAGEKEYEDLRQYVLEDPIEPDTSADNSSEEESTEESDEDPAATAMQRIDLASLKAINKEVVGWIEIPGTPISYPMVHTSDNVYYLTHTFRNEKNSSGSIFVEASNQADFSDLHTIIYGHNMKNGSMFASLKNYAKSSYYKAHPYVYLDLEDGSHCYQIFSCHQVTTSDIAYTIGYQADDIYASFLSDLKNASYFDTGVDVDVNDSIITLSTCTSGGKARFVVHAKKLY